jgi:hypothetical protein
MVLTNQIIWFYLNKTKNTLVVPKRFTKKNKIMRTHSVTDLIHSFLMWDIGHHKLLF